MRMLAMLAAVMVAAFTLAGCKTTSQIDFVNPDSGELMDRVWERKDASHPLAPSTAALFNYDRKTGKVVTEGYVKGDTPVGQIAPIAAAGINAYGRIEAARIEADGDKAAAKVMAKGAVDAAAARVPDQINVNASATGGAATNYAYADGGNAYSVSSAKAMNKTDVTSIMTSILSNRNYNTVLNNNKPLIVNSPKFGQIVVTPGGDNGSKCNAGGGNGSEGDPDCDPGNSGNTPGGDND